MSKKHKEMSAALKFIVYSLIGIFVFFVKIPVGGIWSIPVDHIIAWLKEAVGKQYGFIIFLISGYSVYRHMTRKNIGGDRTEIFLFVLSLTGFLMSGAVLFHIGPNAFLDAGNKALQATGNILCAVFVSSAFVPFLLEYGLVDASGVICRPMMRKLFRTPGSSAVIGVSAFLGNYSMGHVVSRQMYEEGKFTEKETVIVALGFSTCSIGLMLNLANYLDLTEYWFSYVVCILLVTFAVTAIVLRIFPIRYKKEAYKNDIPAACEEDKTGAVLRRAWQAGVARASAAVGLPGLIKKILVQIFPVICEVTGTSMCVIICGTLAASYTDLFFWTGAVFRPFLQISGVAENELYCVQQAMGACLLEPVLSGIVCNGKELSLHARWIVGIVPYSAIIFFAGSIPSILSAKIPCKLWELLVIWAERVCLSILLAGAAGRILACLH